MPPYCGLADAAVVPDGGGAIVVVTDEVVDCCVGVVAAGCEQAPTTSAPSMLQQSSSNKAFLFKFLPPTYYDAREHNTLLRHVKPPGCPINSPAIVGVPHRHKVGSQDAVILPLTFRNVNTIE